MDFRSLIKSNRPVLLDGAMGTELMKRGLEPSGLVNLSHREAVKIFTGIISGPVLMRC